MKKALLALAILGLGFSLAQEVRIMGYGGQDPAVVVRLLDEVIGEQLEAEGITLNYQPLEGDYNAALFNALSAGTAGDIIYVPVETAPGIIDTGKVAPLEGLVETDPYLDSLVESYTFDGQTYGIAKDFNTLAVFYNQDIFDEAGVDYPNEEDTWETFAEKLRGVSDLGPDVYGACFPALFERFGAFAYANGWQPFDEEGNTNLLDPAFVEAVEWYTGLVQEGVAAQPSDLAQEWTGGCLATDNVGVALEGAWILGFLRNEAPNLVYGTTYLPQSPTGERGNFLYTVAYGINSDSQNQEAAARVVEALTSPEAQQFVLEQGLAIPSRESLADNEYFQQDTAAATANEIIFESAERGNVQGFQFGSVGTDWMTPINEALAAIMTGQSDVESALQRAQTRIDELVSRAQ